MWRSRAVAVDPRATNGRRLAWPVRWLRPGSPTSPATATTSAGWPRVRPGNRPFPGPDPRHTLPTAHHHRRSVPGNAGLISEVANTGMAVLLASLLPRFRWRFRWQAGPGRPTGA